MRRFVLFTAAVFTVLCCGDSFAQCYNGRCYQRYQPYSYYGSCQSGQCATSRNYYKDYHNGDFNDCDSGSCSSSLINNVEDCSFCDPCLKTTELRKVETSKDPNEQEYAPESDGLLYAKCVKCGHNLGFRVLESDRHYCPNCKSNYRYFDEKMWYEVETEKRIAKIPVTDTIQMQVFEEINRMRTARGLSPVVYDSSFEGGAQSHSVNMSRRFSCDHNDPTNGCAEICASWQTSPIAAVTAWLYSRGHAAIMLSARYTRCAVGVATDCYGRKYWTARFK